MSNQLNDDYMWVKRCIESCWNKWQVETGGRLIELFQEKHRDAQNEVAQLNRTLRIVKNVIKSQKCEV